MAHGSPYHSKTFAEWCSINGYQAFFQPNTVQLPAGITLNEYGWLNVPSSAEIVIPLAQVLPGETTELYWFSEKIVANSSNPVRISLEGNFQYDPVTGTFPDDKWTTTAGYVVSDAKDHNWSGAGGMIKTKAGEALRLRVHPTNGNTGDFYFKFIAFRVPK